MSEGAPPPAHTHSGGSGLNEKIGPWPLKIWLVALGGTVLVAYYLRKRSAATTPAAAADTSANTDTAQGIGGLAGAGASGYSGNNGSYSQTAGPANNESWLNAAESALAGTGVDAYTADQALLAYLSGQQLTAAQQALFDQVVGLVGPVPIPVPAMPGTGAATTTTTATGTGTGIVTGTQGVAGGAGAVGGLNGTPAYYVPPDTSTSLQASPPPSSAIAVAPPTPVAPAVTYSQVANPTALKALPSGTPLYAKVNGVITYLTPAAYKALPSGTAIYTKA